MAKQARKLRKISIENIGGEGSVTATFTEVGSDSWTINVHDAATDKQLLRETDDIGVATTLALHVGAGAFEPGFAAQLDDECANMFDGVEGALRLIP